MDCNAAPGKERETAVQLELAKTETALNQLSEKVKELIDRLKPITRQEPPSDTAKGETEQEPPCILASKIRDIKCAIEDQSYLVRRQIKLLEI
ncbi:MAG: hypothetical protein ACXAAM_08785 [Candidatus Heimdallarchaeaceae archaeon]|jgi:hypothetical protein